METRKFATLHDIEYFATCNRALGIVEVWRDPQPERRGSSLGEISGRFDDAATLAKIHSAIEKDAMRHIRWQKQSGMKTDRIPMIKYPPKKSALKQYRRKGRQ